MGIAEDQIRLPIGTEAILFVPDPRFSVCECTPDKHAQVLS